jgi:hypothetical protein
MCILITALYDCGHQGQELRRERRIFFHAALILMKRQDDRYDEEIEMNKKDCVSTSKDKQEPRTSLCPTCSVAAAKSYPYASKPAESGEDDVENDYSLFDTPEHKAALADAFRTAAHLFEIKDSNISSVSKS